MVEYSPKFNVEQLSEKQRKVYEQVSSLYGETHRHIARWLWEHHVQIVGSFALALAENHNADPDKCFAAALLHDVADVWYEREDPAFEPKAKHTTQEILKSAGFDEDTCLHFFDEVIETHSAHEGNLPTNLEGKVLATADAMAHLLTSFYYGMHNMGVPTEDEEKFRAWVLPKLDRDLNNKIFFPEVKELAQPYYTKLKDHFTA